ncbi:DNA-processing protein DprA [Flavobacteriaceae bacterium]|nr:DNA-processing protein DprA [Flavobacteriaceae bacterium]
MNLTSIQASLLLQLLPGIGDITAKKLVDHCGSAQSVLNEKRSNLLKIKGIGTFHLKGFSKYESYFDAVKEEEIFLKKEKITPIEYGSSSYPTTLGFCSNAPLVLFQKGKVSWENNRIISVVGTRNPTTRGIDFCKQLIQDLAAYQPIVVSGLARGIDIVAHKAALDQKLETVACLAHGLNQIYPKEHSIYVNKIANQGALLSEFWSTASFEKSNFLKRNRIIAGIAHATLVIESGIKGGSLVTTEHAHHYGRDVFAVPGRVTDRQSHGCLNLIRSDKARMITSASDLAYWMGWELKPKPKIFQKELFVLLTKEEEQVYKLLEIKLTLDKLSLLSKFPISKVASILFQLEMKNYIRPLPGKQFERI